MSRAHKSGRVVRLTAWVDGWVQGVGFRAWGPAQGQRARRGRLGDQPGGRPGRGRGRGQRERMPPAARGTRNRRHAGPGDAGNAMLGARPGRHVGIRGVMTEISAMTPQLREYPSVRQYPFIQIAGLKRAALPLRAWMRQVRARLPVSGFLRVSCWRALFRPVQHCNALLTNSAGCYGASEPVVRGR